MRLGMLRTTFLLSALAFVGACGEPECNDDETLVDGECQPVDPDDSGDTDETGETNEPGEPGGLADISITVSIEQVPNDVMTVLTCNGREFDMIDSYTGRREYVNRYEVPVGHECNYTISDSRGGIVPSGTVVNCSVAVADWTAERVPGSSEKSHDFTVFGCVEGCSDPIAENYEEGATLDDGSCEYIEGCTDERALNYSPEATLDDESCDYGGFGIVEFEFGFGPDVDTENTIVLQCDGQQVFSASAATGEASALMDAGQDCTAVLRDAQGNLGPSGSVRVCGETIASWTSFDLIGAIGSGSVAGTWSVDVTDEFFVPACSGCTNPSATNYDADAYIDDSSCTF